MAGKGKNVEGILKKLEKVIEARQYEHPTKSYVATLWEKGDDYILKKIGEEAAEFIIAGKNKSKNEISNETTKDAFINIEEDICMLLGDKIQTWCEINFL